jgi:hypothetical protein
MRGGSLTRRGFSARCRERMSSSGARTPIGTYTRRRAGLYLNRSRRSIWIHAGSIAAFEALAPLVRALRPQVEIDRFLFTAADPEICEWLRRRYPNDNALPLPFAVRPLARHFLAQLRPALLLQIGPAPELAGALLEEVRGAGVIVLVRDEVPTPGELAPWLERLPREPLADPTAPRRSARLAASRLGTAIAERLASGRIGDWATLRERLGRPRSILCLGNGPSAEDPAVLRAEHDCLLRVNWRWRDRGVLDRPAMVFVGDMRTTLELGRCVFGFRDVAWEREILLRHAILGLRLAPLEHFTLERVPSTLPAAAAGPRPTNGAVMIATAAALGAERVTIAGVDLYRDPRGRYPWDAVGDNAFPQMHRDELEVETIRRALEMHGGETIILSEPLRRALDRPPGEPDRRRSLG